MKTFQTTQGSIAYWTFGEQNTQAPWLVFLPGLTADHRMFEKQIEHFSNEYRCLAWDAPAHYESRPFQLSFSLEDWAKWLHEILQAEGIGRPVLVGQSMGGYVSQMYLDLYPGSVARFVCIDSAPLQRSYYSNWELAALDHTEGMYRSIPWKTLVKWGANGTATSEYGRKLMAEMMSSYEKREYCRLAAHGYRMLAGAVREQRAYQIDCPLLLVCGENDAAGSTKRYNREWVARTGHRIEWIPGAGHNSNTDEPEMVNCLIEDFVRGL